MISDMTELSDSRGISPDERRTKPTADRFKTSSASNKSMNGLEAICDITIDDFSEVEEPWYGESISPNSSPSTRPAFPNSTLVPSRPSSAPPWAAQRDAVQRSPTCSLTQSPSSAHISSGTVSPAPSFSLNDSPVVPKRASPQSYSRSFSLNLGLGVTAANSANFPTPRLSTFSNGTPQLKSTSLDLDKRTYNDMDENKAQVFAPSHGHTCHTPTSNTCSKPDTALRESEEDACNTALASSALSPGNSTEVSPVATQVQKQVHASTAAEKNAPQMPSAVQHSSEKLQDLSEEARELHTTVQCLNDCIDRLRKGLETTPDPFVVPKTSLAALRSELKDAQEACQELSHHSMCMPSHSSTAGHAQAHHKQSRVWFDRPRTTSVHVQEANTQQATCISHPHVSVAPTTEQQPISTSSATPPSKPHTTFRHLPPCPCPSGISRTPAAPVAMSSHMSPQGCFGLQASHTVAGAAAVSCSPSPVTTRSPSPLSHESALHIVPSSILPRRAAELTGHISAAGATTSLQVKHFMSPSSCGNMPLGAFNHMHIRSPQRPSGTIPKSPPLVSGNGVITPPRPCPPVPHSKSAGVQHVRPGALSAKSLLLGKAPTPLPKASGVCMLQPPPPSPSLRLSPVLKSAAAKDATCSTSLTARSPGRLTVPLPSLMSKAQTPAANVHTGGTDISRVSTAMDCSANPRIAHLERQLCEAHTQKRAAQLDAEQQRKLVSNLKQQVSDLTATVHAYRCSAYMPKGPRPYPGACTEQALLSGSGSRMHAGDACDGSWGLRQEKSGTVRLDERGVRRSLHCIVTPPVGCAKIRENEVPSCEEQLHECESVKAIKDWCP